jgi:hypothetical protein
VPSITLSYATGGPLVSVMVAPSQPRQQALKAAGLSLPPPTNGVFLVDTGASNTVIDPSLIGPLGLSPTGTIMCHTPSTGGAALPFNQYDVLLFLPGPAGGAGWLIPALPVMESALSAQGIMGLIGRDVLDRAMLVYNGPAGHFTLAY